jgi:hypothetical protein
MRSVPVQRITAAEQRRDAHAPRLVDVLVVVFVVMLALMAGTAVRQGISSARSGQALGERLSPGRSVAAPVTAAAPGRRAMAPRRTPAESPGPPSMQAPLHGCFVPDLSQSEGWLPPSMGRVNAEVVRAFGDLPVSCWNARGGDPYSDHPKGRACDYTIGRLGSYPGPQDVARGWALADWLRTNAAALHVRYVIWQGLIWSRAYDAEGWRRYTGGGHYSTAGPTNGHYDHVHVSTVD